MTTDDQGVAGEILAAIEGLREELRVREVQDADRTAAMDDLRDELRKERIRRQFLWTPIGILASIITVVVLVFVNDQQQQAQKDALACEQTNAARSTLNEFLDAVQPELDPQTQAYLDQLAKDTLFQQDCSK